MATNGYMKRNKNWLISFHLLVVGIPDNSIMENGSYLSWDDYFLSVAFLSGMRSKDPCTQVGACIVNTDKIIVSIGYNGMPRGCSDDELPWAKESENKINTKYMYVCHAEMNAVLNKNSADVAGCTLYVVLFPCNECAKIIIQSRIKEVVYFSNKHKNKPETIASKKMFDLAGIFLRQFDPKYPKIELDFTLGDMNNVEEKQIFPECNECSIPRDINQKRSDYIAWEEYFMSLVFLSAKRSKDPLSQFGACIVDNDNRIVGIGYNGMPRGCDDSLLTSLTKGPGQQEKIKKYYVCHAEMNAIMNKNCAKIAGCKMYVAFFPCSQCAKFIVQENIKELVYFSHKFIDSQEVKAAKRMFDMVGVTYRSYEGKITRLVMDFNSIDWNTATQLPPSPQKSV